MSSSDRPFTRNASVMLMSNALTGLMVTFILCVFLPLPPKQAVPFWQAWLLFGAMGIVIDLIKIGFGRMWEVEL